MVVKLLTEHHLEVLRLKGGCTRSSESTLVKLPYCWKSHVAARLYHFLFGDHGPHIENTTTAALGEREHPQSPTRDKTCVA